MPMNVWLIILYIPIILVSILWIFNRVSVFVWWICKLQASWWQTINPVKSRCFKWISTFTMFEKVWNFKMAQCNICRVFPPVQCSFCKISPKPVSILLMAFTAHNFSFGFLSYNIKSKAQNVSLLSSIM